MTSTIARAPMTYGEILDAAKIIRAGDKKVTWAVDGDVSRLLTGTVRYMERTNQATGEAAASTDVRDLFLRITTTFEHWLPMSEVLDLMDRSLFVLGDR